MSFNIGENVGPYRIIEQLGQGGMATVYKAYHASLDRYVALKVLHPAFHEDQTFAMRFQREARVVAKLEHPNIVPIYDYSEHEKRPFLVMKYIEGDTLKARLNQGPLAAKEIEQVVNSVGAALAYAHSQGILHRDVKPSNVMIASDGTMYLADFGLARIAEAGESTMSSDSIMGTPQYISPEQAMGKKDLDAGTDIYSFGVMLYEMVVGQVPFSADTPFSIIHDHIYTPLPLPTKVNPKVPEPVQRVLLKALAKDRLDRYTATQELMSAFKAAWTEAGVPMQGTAIIMRPSVSKDKTGAEEKTVSNEAPLKPRTGWMWMGVGIIVLLGLAIAGLAINKRLTPPQATPTLVSTAPLPATPNVPLPPLAKGSSPEISAAMDLVAQNPNDPNAHLTLSLALFDAQEIRAASEELVQAANLAGPNNKEFLLHAAQQLKERNIWVPSAGMYLRLMQAYRNETAPIEIENDFREAAYKATEQKDMSLFLIVERIDRIDQALGHIVRARQELYFGSLDAAQNQLAKAETLKPNMPEAALLKAEIKIKKGAQAEAKDILQSLAAAPKTPEWIRLMAENYLNTIK